jgi:hypothetical protein
MITSMSFCRVQCSCSTLCCLQGTHAVAASNHRAAARTGESVCCAIPLPKLPCLQSKAAAAVAAGVVLTPKEHTYMVSPTAKVDMVVPAKARAHTEPMFLTNLQQFNGHTMQHATINVCGAGCTQRNLAGNDMPLLDPLLYAAGKLCLRQPAACACCTLLSCASCYCCCQVAAAVAAVVPALFMCSQAGVQVEAGLKHDGRQQHKEEELALQAQQQRTEQSQRCSGQPHP